MTLGRRSKSFWLLAAVACASKPAPVPTQGQRDRGGPAAAVAGSEQPEVAQAKPVAPSPEATRVPAPVPPSAARSADLDLTFVGDVIFGRYRGDAYDPIPEGDHPVFDEMKPLLAADVVVGNLETPLVRELPTRSPIGARFRFGASVEHAKYLVDAGFTVMSLANNHWFDQRVAGVEQTPEILRELGIVPIGAAHREPPTFRVETLETQGWRLAFCAITTRTNAPVREGLPQLPYLETDQIATTVAPLLAESRPNHDLVIVVVHWGEEYAAAPNSAQVRAAHALVDAGADLVIGHHPHVLQGVEHYGAGLIAYSLGNFLFENTNDIPRLTGVLGVHARSEGVRGEGACIDRVVFHPAYIKSRPIKHPVPATGGLARQIRTRVTDLSANFKTDWTVAGEDLRLVQPHCLGSKAGGAGG